jgi:glycosyltransferase involved in cell wall biosynthesis
MTELSVVVPVCNEAENVEPLAREIDAALRDRDYEMIFIDDGSDDATAAILLRLKSELPRLRVLRHSFRSGQSAAVASGVRAARAPWVATLDGDGQNDPADIPRLVAARDDIANRGVQLFQGNRKASRKDTAWRKLQSNIANGVRSGLLGDDTPDTGCGIKLFARDGIPGSAALRSHASLHAGAVHAPGRAGDFRARRPSAAYPRHFQVRHAQSRVGGNNRHRRRHVAAPPVQAWPAGSRRLRGLIP